MIYLLLAYTFFWLIIFFYILHLGKTINKLQNDIETLKEIISRQRREE